jgi:hypothetical protein
VNRISWLAIAGLAAVLVGCGSGGGGSSSGGGSTQVGVFVTDSFREDYSHVWATIFSVDLIDSNNNAVNVFSDSTGVIIDLKTLRDANGQRFAFLSTATIPAGTYTKVQVTLAPSLNLIPVGQTTGTTLQLDASLPRDANGNAIVTFNLPAPRQISGSDDVVVDFDLANFRILLGKIVPSLKEGGKTGLNDKNRHEEEIYEGTVSGLSGTAPNFTFTLTRGNRSVTVTTDVNTVIFNANSAPSPTLANGKRVHVTGKFDTTTSTLAATSIKIQSDQQAEHPELKGTASNINSAAGTFDVTVSKTHGLVPKNAVVHIVTTTDTVFRGGSGVLMTSTDFFAALTAGANVEAEGTFDANTSTLTATRVKLDDENEGEHGGHQAEVKGAPTSVNSGAGTFTVNPVTEFDGFTFGGSGGVNIATTGSTAFRATDGSTLSTADFWTALMLATSVKVEGTFAAGTITATSVRIL